MKEKIIHGYQKHKLLYLYLFSSLILLVFYCFHHYTEFPYDSGSYWYGGYAIGMERFNLLNLNNPLRGYLLPLLFYIPQHIAYLMNISPYLCFWIFCSFIYAFTITIAFPALIENVFHLHFPSRSRLLFLLVSMIFFKGLLLYPVSDFMSISFLIYGIHLLMISVNRTNIKRRQKYLCPALSGVCLASSYYIRPMYLIVIIAVFVLGFISLFKKQRYPFAALIIGMAIVALPQVIINNTLYHTLSPSIQTQLAYENGESLFLQQLSWGITMQKCEGNLDLENYPEALMSFSDNIGVALMNAEGIESFQSYSEYIKFVIKHLPDISLIYIKHIFNGIDIVYNNTYIYNARPNRLWIQLLNYTLLFIGLSGVFQIFRNKKWRHSDWCFMICWFLPCLLVIPTAVETRFFIGLALFLYLLASLKIVEMDIAKFKNISIKTFILYVSFLLICFLLNKSTFDTVGIMLL